MRESMRASEGGECDRNESEELKTNIFFEERRYAHTFTHRHTATESRGTAARSPNDTNKFVLTEVHSDRDGRI